MQNYSRFEHKLDLVRDMKYYDFITISNQYTCSLEEFAARTRTHQDDAI